MSTGFLAYPEKVNQLAHAYGVASNPTTTSGTLVNLTDLSVALTTAGGDLTAHTTVNLSGNTAGQTVFVALALDGTVAADSQMQVTIVGSGNAVVLTTEYHWTGVAAGAHTVTTQWATGSGTATAINTARVLLVEETRR